jgi:hypothetical protein
MPTSRLLIGIVGAGIVVLPALAQDHPCVQPRDPFVMALCSDPELRAVADRQRNTMMALWNRLSPEEQDKFRNEQVAWRDTTARRCRVDRPSPLPLPYGTKECLMQAEAGRVEVLQRYGQTETPTPLHLNAPQQVAPEASVAATDSRSDAAYQDGLRDRAAWEEWFNSLPPGDYKTGAFYWVSQRSLPHPGSCRQMDDEFYAGCAETQRRLSPSDARRKSEPEYRTGWNSWTPSAPATPVSHDLVPGNFPPPPASNEPIHPIPTQPIVATAAPVPTLALRNDNTEQQFIDAIDQAAASYHDAPNDMARGAMRVARTEAVRRLLPDRAAQGWVGTIETLSSTNDGRGVLVIRISPRITVQTYNNSLSERLSGQQTLIPVGSPLWSSVVQLAKGDRVRFSGHFVAGNDYLDEVSLTVTGGMTSPDFVMSFSSVQPER